MKENSEEELVKAAGGKLPPDMSAYKAGNGVYVRRRFAASIIVCCVLFLLLALPVAAVTAHAALVGDSDGFTMGCILLFPFLLYFATRYSSVAFRPDSGQAVFVSLLGLRRRRVKITPAFRVVCENCSIRLKYPGRNGRMRNVQLASADVWTEKLTGIAWESKLLLAAATRDREYARSMAAEAIPAPEDAATSKVMTEELSHLPGPAVPEHPLPFPAEPYTSKTLSVGDNRVVFIAPFARGFFLVLTVPYLFIMFLLVMVLRRDYWMIVIFGDLWQHICGLAGITLLWLHFVRKCVSRTEFDVAEGQARSRAFLRFVKKTEFGDLDRISQGEPVSTPPTRGFYLTRKCDPAGFGRLISAIYYSVDDPEVAYLERTVIPMLNSRLRDASKHREAALAGGEMPEDIRCYQLVGRRYIANRTVAVFVSLCIMGYCLQQGFFGAHAASTTALYLAASFWTFVYMMHMAAVVTLDLDAEAMTVHRRLGLSRTTIPFERFVNCGFVTTTVNGIYLGTTLAALYFDADGKGHSCPLKFSRFPTGLAALQRETQGIIAAARARKPGGGWTE